MPTREGKHSVLNLGRHFSIDLRLITHYEYNVLKRSIIIIIIIILIYLSLRVV